jgi:hypothetical protein
MDAELLKKRLADFTGNELRLLIHEAVQEALMATNKPESKRSPLEIPTVDLGPWPENLRLITCDEIYADDDR